MRRQWYLGSGLYLTDIIKHQTPPSFISLSLHTPRLSFVCLVQNFCSSAPILGINAQSPGRIQPLALENRLEGHCLLSLRIGYAVAMAPG